MKWILALWFVIATIAILGVGGTSQSPFDPSLKLAQQSMSLQYEQTLLASLPVSTPVILGESVTTKHAEPTRTTLYHITQGGCFCEWLVRKHRDNLTQWSEVKGVANIDVKLQDYPQLSAMIPSTPAIVAVDEWGKVIYLGPYARGRGCIAGSGQVDEYLQRWYQLSQAQKHSHQPIIETDASGCYCAT
ncbi:MAG: DUF6436 domain-containing protein [Glaciecola sp.]|nr:DUF6436 domain-containing protein [Glaciecola sp.]MDG2100021.1 DUF6436 domain-containing protein [Glaciecola sp.]